MRSKTWYIFIVVGVFMAGVAATLTLMPSSQPQPQPQPQPLQSQLTQQHTVEDLQLVWPDAMFPRASFSPYARASQQLHNWRVIWGNPDLYQHLTGAMTLPAQRPQDRNTGQHPGGAKRYWRRASGEEILAASKAAPVIVRTTSRTCPGHKTHELADFSGRLLQRLPGFVWADLYIVDHPADESVAGQEIARVALETWARSSLESAADLLPFWCAAKWDRESDQHVPLPSKEIPDAIRTCDRSWLYNVAPGVPHLTLLVDGEIAPFYLPGNPLIYVRPDIAAKQLAAYEAWRDNPEDVEFDPAGIAKEMAREEDWDRIADDVAAEIEMVVERHRQHQPARGAKQ